MVPGWGWSAICLSRIVCVVYGKDYMPIEWESFPKMLQGFRQGTLIVTCIR